MTDGVQARAGLPTAAAMSATPGPTIFLREEGATQSVIPPRRDHSPTLRELAELYNISSVLECDSQGHVQPRAVAFDSPSDVLHSGRHYIARRDAKCEQGESRVTFRAKITVKEYELEHPTPQSSIDGVSCVQVGCGLGADDSKASGPVPALPCVPSADQRHDMARAGSDSRVGVPAEQHSEPPPETPPVPIPCAEDAQRRQVADHSLPATPPYQLSAAELARENKENALTMSRPLAPAERKRVRDGEEKDSVQAVCETTMGAVGIAVNASIVPQHSLPPLHFTPFVVDAPPDGGGGDCATMRVTLEYLRTLCADVAEQEAEFARRHRRAEEVIAAARFRLSAVAAGKAAGHDARGGGDDRHGDTATV